MRKTLIEALGTCLEQRRGTRLTVVRKANDARPLRENLLLRGVDAKRLAAAARRQEPYDDRVGEAAADLGKLQTLQGLELAHVALDAVARLLHDRAVHARHARLRGTGDP